MVKRTLATLVLLVAAFMVFGQAADLFFSEYVEGSSNNKALEIFNGTGATVDLSQYAVKLGSNGGEWSATNSIVLSGSLANNEVYVIANAGANATILGLATDGFSDLTVDRVCHDLGILQGRLEGRLMRCLLELPSDIAADRGEEHRQEDRHTDGAADLSEEGG